MNATPSRFAAGRRHELADGLNEAGDSAAKTT
jgi:hypothetical protein